MTKTYTQIVTGLKKTLTECSNRAVHLKKIEEMKREKAAQLSTEASDAYTEALMVERLSAKLIDLTGDDYA